MNNNIRWLKKKIIVLLFFQMLNFKKKISKIISYLLKFVTF